MPAFAMRHLRRRRHPPRFAGCPQRPGSRSGTERPRALFLPQPATRGSAAPVAVGIASEETKMGYPGDDRSGGGDRWQGREQYRGREHGRGGYGGGGNQGDDDRGFLDRAGDEVRSWFGDDEAQRRREMDQRRWEQEQRMIGRRDNDYGGPDTFGGGWGNQRGASWNRERPGERGWYGSGE